ncbi:hypothetical protein B0H13DRAFT_1899935 [Mycena leptocephala]|nr:hypothetical protein B0H13DRAFT_1899935 [Mycena leptocephala]
MRGCATRPALHRVSFLLAVLGRRLRGEGVHARVCDPSCVTLQLLPRVCDHPALHPASFLSSRHLSVDSQGGGGACAGVRPFCVTPRLLPLLAAPRRRLGRERGYMRGCATVLCYTLPPSSPRGTSVSIHRGEGVPAQGGGGACAGVGEVAASLGVPVLGRRLGGEGVHARGRGCLRGCGGGSGVVGRSGTRASIERGGGACVVGRSGTRASIERGGGACACVRLVLRYTARVSFLSSRHLSVDSQGGGGACAGVGEVAASLGVPVHG